MDNEINMGPSFEVTVEGNIRDQAHQALDNILGHIEQDSGKGYGAMGGEAELSFEHGDPPHSHTYRLTFADITNRKKCVWCVGTGLEGS